MERERPLSDATVMRQPLGAPTLPTSGILGSRSDVLGPTSSMAPRPQRKTIPFSTKPDSSDTIGSPRSSRRLPIQTYLNTFDEWHRPERVASLYSSLNRFKPGSEFSGNEFAYNLNLQWWIKVITGSARRGFLSTYQPTKPIRFYTNDYSPSISSTYGVADTEPTGSALGLLEIEEDTIIAKFTRGGRRPVCIKTVLEEMKQRGMVVPRSEYLPWGGVGMPTKMVHMFIKVPISWSFRRLNLGSPVSSTPKAYTSIGLASARFDSRKDASQSGRIGLGIGGLFGGSSSSSQMDKETYILLDIVKDAAEKILQLHEQLSQTYYKSDNLMTFADFRELFSRRALEPLALHGDVPLSSTSGVEQELILTDRDLEIVIRALQYEYHALITGPLDPTKPATELTDREFIIKFIEPEDRNEITSADRGTIELRETGRKLHSQVQDLEHRVQELTVQAKTCVARGQKVQAMMALRSKKVLKSVLEKRCSSLETVNNILFRIQTAQTDVEILQTLQKGSQTLKDVLAQKSEDGQQILSTDNIEDTMDQLADLLADQEEVDEAIQNANEIVTPQIDETDLLDELDKLARSSSVEAPSPTTIHDTEMKPADATTLSQSTTSIPVTSARSRSSSPVTATTLHKESPSSMQSPSMKAKRVAESIDQTVKQRKLSQESVVNQRQSGNANNHLQQTQMDLTLQDQTNLSPTSSPRLEQSEPESIVTVQPITTAELVGYASKQSAPVEQLPSSPTEQPPASEMDSLGQEDEAELNALMMELNDLKAPDGPITSPSSPRKRQEEAQAMFVE